MTIEQARQQIKAYKIPMENLLDELEWYRSQDLVRRCDAIEPIRERMISAYKRGVVNMGKAYRNAELIIEQTPKAEYRGCGE